MDIKRVALLLLVIITTSLTANAQFKPYSLGLRFGGGFGIGTEASYQSMLTEDNRLEANLGLYSSTYWSSFSLNLGYQWLFPIVPVEGLCWYAGANTQLGSWANKYENYDEYYDGEYDDGTYIGIGGTVGIEYTLPNDPVQFSIDTRPMINFINPIYGDSFNFGGALAVRYLF